jgi:hypothetical protein
MEARKTVLGPDHSDTLLSMASLASIWNSQGRYHDAFELMEQCAQGRIRVLGPEHPDTKWALLKILDWRIREPQTYIILVYISSSVSLR